MKFSTKEELIAHATIHSACQEALEWAAKQPDLQSIIDNISNPEWIWWCVFHSYEQFYHKFNPLEVSSGLVATLVVKRRKVMKNFKDWSIFDLDDWVYILSHRPELKKHIPDEKWKEFKTYHWVELLCSQPQFAEQCDDKWYVFNGEDIARILSAQPSLSKYVDECMGWKRMSLIDLRYLKAFHPELAKHYKDLIKKHMRKIFYEPNNKKDI